MLTRMESEVVPACSDQTPAYTSARLAINVKARQYLRDSLRKVFTHLIILECEIVSAEGGVHGGPHHAGLVAVKSGC